MRITPTNEQLAYIASLGVNVSSAPPPTAAQVAPTALAPPSAAASDSFVGPLIALVATIVGVLVTIAIVMSK